MFSDHELQQYCRQRSLSAKACQVISQIRGGNPMRRVQSGIKNVPVRYPSRKMGCTLQAESHTNELGAIVAWDNDRDTFEFYDQPSTVKFTYCDGTGRRRGHNATPDFFVLQRDFTGWVECKTEDWLQKDVAKGSMLYVADGHGGWRCPPGEEYASQFGLGFRVRSSAETNWTAVRNAQFLSDYIREKAPAATPDQRRVMQELFDDRAWILLIDLLARPDELPADTIFGALVASELFVDLSNDLLAQPERTRVYRDERTMKAFQASLSTTQLPISRSVRPVTAEVGARVLWDGRQMVVLGITPYIVLQDDENAILTLNKEDFDKLVTGGAICGLPEKPSIKDEELSRLLAQASPKDLDAALVRCKALGRPIGNAPEPGVTSRTLRKWRALYRRGVERTGVGFIGVIPRLHDRGNRRRKLDPRVIQIMDEIIAGLHATSNANTKVATWGEVRNRCEVALLPPPSEKAFRHQLKRWSQYQLTVAREGEKAAYKDEPFVWFLEEGTPRHGERPFEIAHIDHTQLDLQLVGSRYGELLGKPWLTIMKCSFTRMVIAWSISFDPPSYRSCMAVLRDCVRRHQRVPETIVVDNGSEFDSRYFEALLASLEITKKSRPGGKPRFGSVVERCFGITNKALVHNLTGNNKALQKPRQMSATHDPRRLAVWTLPVFTQVFDGFLDNYYHAVEHSALGMSPKEMMAVGLVQTGQRVHRRVSYKPEIQVLFLPTTPTGEATVDSARGVKINYIYYWTEKFRNPLLRQKKVPVRYDPYDISRAYAYVENCWVLVQSEYAATFAGCTEKEIHLITEAIHARNSNGDKRRAINASQLAKFLSGVCETEALLRQQSKDVEYKTAQQDAGKAGDEPVASPSHVLTEGWGGTDDDTFGEF